MTSEEAMQILREMIPTIAHCDRDARRQIALRMAIEALQERKSGKWEKVKWIHCKGSGFLCSECNSGVKNQPVLCGKPMFIYCPFCGAKMEGGNKQ